jgi:hypothetical protein
MQRTISKANGVSILENSPLVESDTGYDFPPKARYWLILISFVYKKKNSFS